MISVNIKGERKEKSQIVKTVLSIINVALRVFLNSAKNTNISTFSFTYWWHKNLETQTVYHIIIAIDEVSVSKVIMWKEP